MRVHVRVWLSCSVPERNRDFTCIEFYVDDGVLRDARDYLGRTLAMANFLSRGLYTFGIRSFDARLEIFNNLLMISEYRG
jgi:hypothetical protein